MIKNLIQNKKAALAWIGAALFYFILQGMHLHFPQEMYYDEVYQVKTARMLIELSGYSQTTHPPFGIMLIAASILLFGDYSWAWRVPSLFAGWGCLVMIYWITKHLTKSNRAAWLAATLFFFDGLSMTQARIGMLNAIMLFFMLSCLWFLMSALPSHGGPLSSKRLKAAGLFLGLAIGTRWVAMSLLPLVVMLAVGFWIQSKQKKKIFWDMVIYLILWPFIVYLASFTIFLFIKDRGWVGIWDYQRYMISYNVNLKAGHTYGSAWWSWPFLSRPIWYFYNEDLNSLANGGKIIRGILSIGNPVIYWFMFLGIIYLVIDFIKKRSWVTAFILLGFFTQWLQWAPVTRVKFFHYFYTAMPFVAMALGLYLDRLWQSGPRGRIMTVIYMVCVIAMFIYWYPLYNGIQISENYFRHHMWFTSWI